MTPVITRILSRYVASALVTYGLLSSPDATAIEPDIAILIGAALGALTEAFYALAKRNGGAT